MLMRVRADCYCGIDIRVRRKSVVKSGLGAMGRTRDIQRHLARIY